jgi:hypothetical protein
MKRLFFAALALSLPSPALACVQSEAVELLAVPMAKKLMRVISADASGLRMEVDHDFWLSTGPEGMSNYGAVINCAIAGPGKQISQIVFVSSRTGQPINAYRGRKIVAP